MFGAANKCVECGKSVYYAEQIKFKRDFYHKTCFKCDRCEKVLPNIAKAHDTNDQKFCGACYAKENGPKGYGYQGVMQPTGKGTKEREAKAKPKTREQEVEERRNRTGRVTYGGGGSKCAACGKSVYYAEQKKALGNVYHKQCFKCADCGKTIATVGDASDKEGQLFCGNCYRKNFGPKGFGFGNAVAHTNAGGTTNSITPEHKKEAVRGGIQAAVKDYDDDDEDYFA